MLDPSLYKEVRKIRIGNTEIGTGLGTRANYFVGSLPSDTKVGIQMEIFRSDEPGPHILIVAGLHGDEVNGVEVVRRTLEQNLFSGIRCGSVIVIPLLNVYGFINFSRDVPAGKDVNRSFPGSLSGSMASRVAAILSRHVLPQVDVVIDFHTGGQNRYNYPQVRISKGDERSLEIARAFNAPFILHKGHIRGSLRRTAHKAGKPCLIYEGGEALRLDGYAITRGIKGIGRTLQFLGMAEGQQVPEAASIEILHATWVRATASGLFIWSKDSGKHVLKGEPLGTIGDPAGTKRVVVTAPRDGFIIGHSNAPVVNQGDPLFNIGY
jgi:predicted deacylase